MIELDQIKYKLNTYEEPLKEMKDALKLDDKKATIADLETSMEKADFWDDTQKSQEVMKQLKVLKQDVEDFKSLVTAKEDIDTLLEMGYEENDPELIPEIEEAMEEFLEQGTLSEETLIRMIKNRHIFPRQLDLF